MSEEAIFKIGDVVRLKSGGASMMVCGVEFRDNTQYVDVTWLSADAVPQARWYPQSFLERAAPTDSTT